MGDPVFLRHELPSVGSLAAAGSLHGDSEVPRKPNVVTRGFLFLGRFG